MGEKLPNIFFILKDNIDEIIKYYNFILLHTITTHTSIVKIFFIRKVIFILCVIFNFFIVMLLYVFMVHYKTK